MSMPFNWMAAGGRAAGKEAQKCIGQWRERSLLRSDQQVADLQVQTDFLMDRIKQIYKEFTKIPPKKLDEMLKHDVFLDAKHCIQYGLCDEII